MKTQVLADLVAECTIPDNNPEVESNDKIKSVEIFKLESISVWVLHIDGASNTQGSGADLILINFEGMVIEYAIRFNFKVSNNQAEYETLLAGLRIAKELDIDNLKVFTYSQWIIGQVKDEFEVRDPVMMKYLQKDAGIYSYHTPPAGEEQEEEAEADDDEDRI
ncbi:uncharacterized protein [Elaeis guineensis]|uniref:uncharacterized protein n=1 Tax=Elaeis guineensis var. tenera TaxID=51953 RepID=UPI003C6CCCD6